MKKTLLIILTLAAALNTGLAQNVDDALRYSQIFYNGTARFNSMGGAFTALGGDISSLSLNPAGLGLFPHLKYLSLPNFIISTPCQILMGVKMKIT